jgi:hypothetical protein
MSIESIISEIVTPSNITTIIVGILTGIFSFFIAIKYYYSPPEPVYLERGFLLARSKDPELDKKLELSFEEKPIPRLSKYYLIFWNKGKQTLNGEDIQTQDPITIEFTEGTDILDVRSLNEYKEKKIIDFKSEKVNNKLFLKFNYLDCNQGFTLEILHTDENPYPKLMTGTIKGVPSGIKNLGAIIPENMDIGIFPEFFKKFSLFKKVYFLVVIFLAYSIFMFILQLALLFLSFPSYFSISNSANIISLFLYGGFSVFLIVLLLIARKRKCPDQLKIKDFGIKI